MPNQLSGGMKKRAGLARALVLEPGIVICDEPDSGLDPVRTALLGDLLLEQHGQLGGTILVITHNIELATRISDHISVLWGGEGARVRDGQRDPSVRQPVRCASSSPGRREDRSAWTECR